MNIKKVETRNHFTSAKKKTARNLKIEKSRNKN